MPQNIFDRWRRWWTKIMESKLRGLFQKGKGRSFLPGRKSYAAPSQQSQTEFVKPRPPQPQPQVSGGGQSFIIGDRVCISGVKSGHLLYFGRFALGEGLWCGIELDEPVGKHDGEVQGVRYFSCRPAHGIFAPVDRVSLASEKTENPLITSEGESGKSLRSKLQRRTLPPPKTYYSQLSRDSSSEKGSLESLSSQSDTGSESNSQKSSSSKKSCGESQIKKPKLSFLRKPSSIPKVGKLNSPVDPPTEGLNATQVVAPIGSGLVKPKNYGVQTQIKLQGFIGKPSFLQKKSTVSSQIHVLNTTQELSSQSPDIEASVNRHCANKTQIVETKGDEQTVQGGGKISRGKALEKRSKPEDKSLPEQDSKRQRVSQLPLSKLPQTTRIIDNQATCEYSPPEQVSQLLEGTFVHSDKTGSNIDVTFTGAAEHTATKLNGTFTNDAGNVNPKLDGTFTSATEITTAKLDGTFTSGSEQTATKLDGTFEKETKLNSTFTSVQEKTAPILDNTFVSAPPNESVPSTLGLKGDGTFNLGEDDDLEDNQAFSPEVHRQLVAGGRQYMNLTFGTEGKDHPESGAPDELSHMITSPVSSAKCDDHAGEDWSELDSSLEFLKGDRLIGEATRLGILKPGEWDDTHLLSFRLLDSPLKDSTSSAMDADMKANVTFDRNDANIDKSAKQNVTHDKPAEGTYDRVPTFNSPDFETLNEASSLGVLKSVYYNQADCTNLLAENPRIQELRLASAAKVGRVKGSALGDFEEENVLAAASDRTRISSVESDNFDLGDAVVTSTPLVSSKKSTVQSEQPSVHATPEDSRSVSITGAVTGTGTNIDEIRRNLDFTNNAVQDGNVLLKTDAKPAEDGEEESPQLPADIHPSEQGPQNTEPTCIQSENIPVLMHTSAGMTDLLKEPAKPMTDSGIDNVMISSQEMFSSQTSSDGRLAQTVGSGSRGDNLEQILAERNQLASDLMAGHSKTERPLSLISSISSVDTGYVPDTDSERGTLTTNSPTEWLDRQDVTQIHTDDLHQQGVLRGSMWRDCLDRKPAMGDDRVASTYDAQLEREDSRQQNGDRSQTDTTLDTDGENSETESSTDVTEIMVSKQAAEKQIVSGDSCSMSEERSHDSSQDPRESSQDTNMEHESGESDKIHDKENQSIDNEKKSQDGKTESKSQTKGKKHKITPKIDHKKPNTNVGSKVAEYLKNTPPLKQRTGSVESVSKAKKNLTNKKKTDSILNKSNKSETGDEENKPVKRERVKVVKEVPKIVKSSPKSKWGNIMSTIEANKDSPPKAREKPKSLLESIFSQAPPPKPECKKTETPKSVKKKLAPAPKPDYSNVKSRLNTGTSSTKPASQPDIVRTGSTNSAAVILHLDLSSSVNGSMNDSAQSACSSRSDISGIGHPEGSSTRRSSGKAGSRTGSLMKQERPHSEASIRSEDVSTNSVKVMNEKNIQRAARRKSEIKSSIPPIAPLPRRARSSPGKTPEPSTSKQTTKSATPAAKRTSSTANQNRNKGLKSKSGNNTKSAESSQEKNVKSAEEIGRLEALCESRTKELNRVKMQLKSGITAFDAMSALVNYLTQELDAFSCPTIKSKLDTIQKELVDTQKQLADSEEHKKNLEEEIASLNRQHDAVLSSLNSEHADELLKAKQVLEEEHKAKIKKMKEKHLKEAESLKEALERNLQELDYDNQEKSRLLKVSHKEEIHSLQVKHENQMEELHQQHRDKLEDVSKAFDSIKISLLEKVDMLKNECVEMKERARVSEEALLRDSDVKMQIALAPYKNLPQEIESLKLVIEMRNEEIRDLKRQKIEADMLLRELPEAKEKVNSLTQKVENLQAVVCLRADQEKQLSDKCRDLMKRCDEENKQNKRLSMNVEELKWKIAESGSEFGSSESLAMKRQLSHSPPPHRRLKSTSSCSDTSLSPAVLRRNGSSSARKPQRRWTAYEDRSGGSSPSPSSLSVHSMSQSLIEYPVSVCDSSASEMDVSVWPYQIPPRPEPLHHTENGQVEAEASFSDIGVHENGAFQEKDSVVVSETCSKSPVEESDV